MMSRRPGQSLRGGVPKDFIRITAISVAVQCGNGQASPHLAAIRITTDNTVTVLSGTGGTGVHTERISWGKEAAEGRNIMVVHRPNHSATPALSGPGPRPTARFTWPP